jgi:acylphosphatase
MNHDHDSSELLTFVIMNEDGSFKINICGTPNRLKNLAETLLKQAGVDQSTMTYLKDYDTDHTHYKPTFKGSILSPSSDELQLGRLDVRTGELDSWAKERIRSTGDDR